MLFVDIAKAFDKIWHDGLLSKMMRLGFSDQLIKIIHSYLNSREFRVRVETVSPPHVHHLSGVPQGSLLGPKLLIYTSTTFSRAVGVHLAMYATTLPFLPKTFITAISLSGYKIMSFDSKTWLNDWKNKG
ncbi:putative RNA-directed DNA polymerase from transposon BS [Trichonephila clavipes]|nr:putative RNA-directed DNA polymerase from transposon BS [Trichonephila clavipes]